MASNQTAFFLVEIWERNLDCRRADEIEGGAAFREVLVARTGRNPESGAVVRLGRAASLGTVPSFRQNYAGATAAEARASG
jgi:hypothetical protein